MRGVCAHFCFKFRHLSLPRSWLIFLYSLSKFYFATMSHNGGWRESGDHRQNVFSSIATTTTTTTTASASGYFVGDSFLPFGVDAGDAQRQFENVDDYLVNDDVDDERQFNYLAQSDYQQPLPQPEINAQYLKELETDKCFLASLCQALAPPYFYHAAKVRHFFG